MMVNHQETTRSQLVIKFSLQPISRRTLLESHCNLASNSFEVYNKRLITLARQDS
jgi:hypothetical protein